MIELLGFESRVKLLPFGSAIIMELHKDANESYYVQILFKTNEINDPISLEKVQITNCSMLCPISALRNVTNDRVLTNHREACKLNEPITTTVSTTPANTTTVPIRTSFSPLKKECTEMKGKNII